MPVLTKPAVQVWNPVDATSNPRGSDMSEEQRWGMEIEQAIGNPAQLTGATFTGGVGVKAVGYGGVKLAAGQPTATGYIELFNAAGIRSAYIGYAGDNGVINYMVENGLTGHNFAGTGAFSEQMTIAGSVAHHDGNASRGAPDVVIEDQKASGTPGGTSSAGWSTRAINTVARNNGQCTNLTSSTFIFASNGWLDWSTEVLQSGVAKTRLWNVTDNVVVSYGSNVFSAAVTAYCSMTCTGSGPIVAGKQYRLEQYVQTAVATVGLGIASGQGIEVFAQVKFWRL